VLGRILNQKSIFPPVDVLPSLSRLMKEAIGEGHTREDHQSIADQIYSFYAEGRELEKLVAIIGEASLTEQDQRVLNFSKRFEQKFVNQGTENRSIEQTLDLAWDLLSDFPKESLKRIPEIFIEKYYKG
jgi:V/A-type H+-transporting ATPase subunit B